MSLEINRANKLTFTALLLAFAAIGCDVQPEDLETDENPVKTGPESGEDDGCGKGVSPTDDCKCVMGFTICTSVGTLPPLPPPGGGVAVGGPGPTLPPQQPPPANDPPPDPRPGQWVDPPATPITDGPLERTRLPSPDGNSRYAYRISPNAVAGLSPLFNRFNKEGRTGYDLSRIEFQWGSTPGNVLAYTFGDRVTINKTAWDKLTELEKLQTVAHEATHSLQYDILGVPSFLSRYDGEYRRHDNYSWPPGTALPSDPTDTRYTLDQIAMGMEALVRLKYVVRKIRQ